jgi:hypothetical protein
MDAEDWRDHMPCPGSRAEQLEAKLHAALARVRELETALEAERTAYACVEQSALEAVDRITALIEAAEGLMDVIAPSSPEADAAIDRMRAAMERGEAATAGRGTGG